MKKAIAFIIIFISIVLNIGCKRQSTMVNSNTFATEPSNQAQTEEYTKEPQSTQAPTQTVTEPQTYVLEEGVIDSNPGVLGERYTYIDHFNQEFSMVLQKNANKTTFDIARLKKEGNKYEYYSADGKRLVSKWGIDVSIYQGNIDWKTVKAAGVEFVIIRLGYRGYGSAGNIVYDKCFKQNIEGALAAGLEVGVYFFSQALNDEEALEEANFVLEAIKDYNIIYPVVFDTEEIDASLEPRTKDITRDRVTKNCIIFCDAIKAAGYKPMIYYNMPWCAEKLDLEKLNAYDIWYADYTAIPQSPYKFSMWQYTGSGRISGIRGDVDLNMYILEE